MDRLKRLIGEKYIKEIINGYANIKEKNSRSFKKIMRKLKRYRQTGPIGPNKYWEYPWALINARLLKETLKILDAGCGKAPVQYFLAELGHEVHGIDPRENVEWHGINKNLTKNFGLNITYKVEGIENISYSSDTFDRVFCLSVIEHCRADREAIERFGEGMTPQTDKDRELHGRMMKEMARVLKPGGLLIITVDFNLPSEKFLLEANVDIKNLIDSSGLELYGNKENLNFYGFNNFDIGNIYNNPDIDIVDYCDSLQTSLGFILKKSKDRERIKPAGNREIIHLNRRSKE